MSEGLQDRRGNGLKIIPNPCTACSFHARGTNNFNTLGINHFLFGFILDNPGMEY
jgi:hypothetical protein